MADLKDPERPFPRERNGRPQGWPVSGELPDPFSAPASAGVDKGGKIAVEESIQIIGSKHSTECGRLKHRTTARRQGKQYSSREKHRKQCAKLRLQGKSKKAAESHAALTALETLRAGRYFPEALSGSRKSRLDGSEG